MCRAWLEIHSPQYSSRRSACDAAGRRSTPQASSMALPGAGLVGDRADPADPRGDVGDLGVAGARAGTPRRTGAARRSAARPRSTSPSATTTRSAPSPSTRASALTRSCLLRCAHRAPFPGGPRRRPGAAALNVDRTRSTVPGGHPAACAAAGPAPGRWRRPSGRSSRSSRAHGGAQRAAARRA